MGEHGDGLWTTGRPDDPRLDVPRTAQARLTGLLPLPTVLTLERMLPLGDLFVSGDVKEKRDVDDGRRSDAGSAHLPRAPLGEQLSCRLGHQIPGQRPARFSRIAVP